MVGLSSGTAPGIHGNSSNCPNSPSNTLPSTQSTLHTPPTSSPSLPRKLNSSPPRAPAQSASTTPPKLTSRSSKPSTAPMRSESTTWSLRKKPSAPRAQGLKGRSRYGVRVRMGCGNWMARLWVGTPNGFLSRDGDVGWGVRKRQG